MIGPLTNLVICGEPYAPTKEELLAYEKLAADGFADISFVGKSIGFRINSAGSSEFRAWAETVKNTVRFP